MSDDKTKENQDHSINERSEMVNDKPGRRTFSPEFKAKILEELVQCKRGEVGKLLRREGLYATQIAKWKAEAEDALIDVFSKKRGPKPNTEAKLQREIEKLKAQLETSNRRLGHAEAIIDIQKKVSEMFGIQLPKPPDQKPDND
jgi:transposase-like protein